MKRFLSFILLLLSFVILGCKSDSPSGSVGPTEPVFTEKIVTSGKEICATALAVNGDEVYIAYCQEDSYNEHSVHFAKSTDGGNSWATTKISDVGSGGRLDLSFNNGILYFIFTSEHSTIDYNYDIKLTKSNNNGETWSSFETVLDSTGTETGAYVPKIAMDNGSPFITYMFTIDSNFHQDINLAEWDGSNWSHERVNTREAGEENKDLTSPSIYIFNETIYIVVPEKV